MPLPSNAPIRPSAALLSACLMLAGASATAAPERIALVLGNSDYYNLPATPACAAAMKQVGKALDGLEYRVVQRQDGTSGGTAAAMAAFQRALDAAPAASAIVYFCGHAASMDDRLFVLPVSASLIRPSDVRTQGILAKAFVDLVERGRASRALVLMDLDSTEPLSPQSLDALKNTGMSDGTGLVVAVEALDQDRSTPFAGALAAGLADPDVETTSLLRGLQSRLIREGGTKLGAIRMPARSLALAEVDPPVPVAATPAPVPEPPVAAAAPPQLVPQPAPRPVAAAARPEPSLPDEAGMSAEQRRMVQIGLARFGYYGGRIDSLFGPETRAAIRQYQGEIGAEITGVITGAQATRLLKIP